jgi:hypothetical protein
LRRPLGAAVDGKVAERPVIQEQVTVIDLVLPDGQDWTGFSKHIGHARTIEGTLGANEWWHYGATVKMTVKSIR